MKSSVVSMPGTSCEQAAEVHRHRIDDQRSSWARYLTLFVLFLICTINIIDRYLLVFLYSAPVGKNVSPDQRGKYSMKEDLNISSSQYGMLTGPAFMIFASVTGIFAGWTADNLHRKSVALVSLTFLSLATAAMGFATEFWHVLGARLLQAIGQAFAPALGYSIIADYFAKDERGVANGFFASGIYGGYAAASLSLLLIADAGWRKTTFAAAAIGGAMVLLGIVTVAEPLRERFVMAPPARSADASASTTPLLDTADSPDSAADAPAAPSAPARTSLWNSVVLSLAPVDMRVLIAAAALRMAGGVVLGSFLPAYFKDAFPTQADEFAVLNSVVCFTAGTASSLLGGKLADALAKRASARLHAAHAEPTVSVNATEAGASTPSLAQDLAPYALVAAASCIASLPLFAAAFFIPNLYGAMGALFAAYLLSECWFAPVFCIIHNYTAVPAHVKGIATALAISGTSALGSLGPMVFGLVDDRAHSMQWELLGGVLGPNFLAGLLFLVVARMQHRFAVAQAAAEREGAR